MSDSLKTFIDSIIIKTEESEVSIKRTRSARRQEERKEDDPKQKLSKKVRHILQVLNYLRDILEPAAHRQRDSGTLEQF